MLDNWGAQYGMKRCRACKAWQTYGDHTGRGLCAKCDAKYDMVFGDANSPSIGVVFKGEKDIGLVRMRNEDDEILEAYDGL